VKNKRVKGGVVKATTSVDFIKPSKNVSNPQNNKVTSSVNNETPKAMQLRELQKLYQDGVITFEEFTKAKGRLLDKF
jgi:hypothetical protein